MKKVLIGFGAVAAVFLLSISSCTKTNTHTITTTDTVTVVDTLKPPVGDTTYKHINDSLWAYYPLNGNLGDSSGNNHVLSLVGGGVSLGFDLWGHPQGALDFTPSSSYAEIADGVNFNAPSFSVSLFAMYRQPKGLLLSKVDYSNAFGSTFNVGIDPANFGDTLRVAGCTDANICSETPTSVYNLKDPTENVQLYAWYHIVANFSNGLFQLYINGQLVSSETLPVQQLSVCTSAPFILGNWWQQDNGPALDGKIDEIRIYTRVLKSNEVAYLYNNFRTN